MARGRGPWLNDAFWLPKNGGRGERALEAARCRFYWYWESDDESSHSEKAQT